MSTRKPILSITKKDLDIQFFRDSGNGGQHRNKVETAVRIIHRESGAIGQATEDRSQHRNKQMAFKRLIESKEFNLWIKRKVGLIPDTEKIKQVVEAQVEEWMQEDNLKIETF